MSAEKSDSDEMIRLVITMSRNGRMRTECLSSKEIATPKHVKTTIALGMLARATELIASQTNEIKEPS